MMRYNLLILFSLLLFSCGNSENTTETAPVNVQSDKQEPDTAEQSSSLEIPVIEEADQIDYNYSDYVIVIADTGQDYYQLHEKMTLINEDFGIEIDTMDRYYDKEKDHIILPEDHDDELYAGNFYPRRYEGHFLSLEYLNFYQQKAGTKTIALVTGIYENMEQADSVLNLIKPQISTAFLVKSELYVGCMH